MHEYLPAIRQRVCLVCVDGIFKSKHEFVRCGLSKNWQCPVEQYLPKVVEVVESVDSSKMDDYFALLHEKVCLECEQSKDGVCELRLKSDCPLDRYFMLVAGAIEEVKGARKNFDKNDIDDSISKCSDDKLSPTPW